MKRRCISIYMYWEPDAGPKGDKLGPGWVARGVSEDDDGDRVTELVAIDGTRSTSPTTLAARARREFGPSAAQLEVEVRLGLSRYRA